jgi:hypothetical protein
MNETPIAVISGTRRGARRSGLYATRSMVALRRAHPAMANKSATKIAGMRVPRAGSSCRLNMLNATVAAIIPPIMNTSPWAKLISSRMP